MTFWGELDQVHAQNMEQLHAFQNVAEPQATEYHIKYTHVYTGTGVTNHWTTNQWTGLDWTGLEF